MLPRSDVAYRLAQQILHLRLEANHELESVRPHSPQAFESPWRAAVTRIEGQWAEDMLQACEDAIGHYHKLLAEVENTRVRPIIVTMPAKEE